MFILPLLLALNFPTTAASSQPVLSQPASQPISQATSQVVERAVAIPKHADLHLQVPADWKLSSEPPTPGLAATVHLVDLTGKLEMLISVLPAPDGADAKSFNSVDRLKSIANAQGAALLNSATETSLDLENVTSANVNGFVYTLTDKAPAKGSFEYMTAGVVGTGDVILSATILMHEKNPPARATALDILRSASQSTHTSPATTQTSGTRTLSVSLEDKSWQVSIDLPAGVKLARDETSPDKHAREITAVDDSHKLIVSLFIEPAAGMGDAKLARQVYFDRLKSSPILMRDDKFSDGPNGSARADYDVPNLDQHHVNLYFSKEGTWVDVHLSLEAAKVGEQAMSLDDIVKSVRIESKPAMK